MPASHDSSIRALRTCGATSEETDVTTSIDEQLNLLARGCEAVYSADELGDRLRWSQAEKRPLRVKLGMDPTAPDLTLGHTVVLRKLRQFQDLGHKGVLIIGDYTAMIGDPTGRTKTRPVLTREEIETNAATYLQQAGTVLDTSPDKLEIRHNSEWLGSMDFAQVIRLTAQVTVARMLERDTFAQRRKRNQEIYIHELLYPLMQARDSVVVESDVELGGTDQTFNNLMGRDLQRNAGQRPQVVMITPLLIGTDGREKMSKSMGNYIAVTEPAAEMFAKVMSIPDELTRSYFTLLTALLDEEIDRLTDPAKTHPRDAKVTLGKSIVAGFHSAADADAAEAEFSRIHGAGKKGIPDEVPDAALPSDVVQDGRVAAIELVRQCGFAASNSEARRLIAEKGVRINGEPIGDPHDTLPIKSGDIVQRGKRKFVRIQLASR